MKYVTGTIAWIYDFLAEDIVLVIGIVLAVIITIIAVHVSARGAGFILWALVLLAIVVSLARTAIATRG